MLVVTPMQEELDLLVGALGHAGHPGEPIQVGRLAAVQIASLGLTAARGGTGKAQFAAQTQHLLDGGRWRRAVCAGAAGALSPSLRVGDVVAATETIEHDFRNLFTETPLPRFSGDNEALGLLRELALNEAVLRLGFGPVASGDEDIVTEERRAELEQATGALAVAWEGAGGARACAFSGVPFLELRGITDSADAHAPASFEANLERAMASIAAVLIASGGLRAIQK